VTRRRGRRRKQLVDDLGDRRWYSHLKEEALNRTKWRNRFGRGCGPVVWQITDELANKAYLTTLVENVNYNRFKEAVDIESLSVKTGWF
jgi:hypothetical protein